ncbi:hypothetical protein LEP1GSC016_0328 [Leptospira borgpetersenii serovar Hardjo-bovis str. Sponselee]|uniref:Uncharacterized protein n=6 Tax=Leptospira borgpetersenii TaxID=174 RepID=M3HPY0_LEPBO|nr:hypothetical protein LBBP_03998 [Leptospira borgpetersenii serovar Ballum]EKP12752.1 hypothetical protein LEP1GSC128_3675 [Leptospira borgpetersenii str. 200801926]EKQ91116.1 hypothetical protein LEP1GSC101_0874 [Leptospira borgpetersenii str. UI 09149]EKR01643.1 hypothetical protein LEP1GSC121_0246 [Leptospira borgpetersenii serovar Castellonis str. 200801910]EMG00106.1 hypothetical protein LEP1GSC123_2052 [Leptospira borgpetersenii str. 200701203]EMJ82148.1 hypothetical protein LEP1GSC016
MNIVLRTFSNILIFIVTARNDSFQMIVFFIVKKRLDLLIP